MMQLYGNQDNLYAVISMKETEWSMTANELKISSPQDK